MSYLLYSYGGYALAAVAALLVIAALIYIVRLDGVRMREITGTRYRPLHKKGWIYVVTAGYFLVSIMICGLEVPRSCTATLSLNYDGASSGLYPNGTKFNQADVLGSEVLNIMEDKHVLSDVTAEDLADVLDISAKSSGGIDGDNYRVSTEYRIKYSANGKTDHLDGENVLQVFSAAYREWLSAQYTTNLEPLSKDYSEFNGEDYLDICDLLSTEADRIANFMYTLSENTRSFQSEDTGEGFSSIETRADYIRDTLVADLRAYVLENSLSKDTQTYLGRLSAENIFLDFEARKDRMTSNNWLAVMRKYEDDMARIVLVPTYDSYGQFYMSQTKIGVDEFAEEAEESADKMIELHARIADNEYIADKLSAEGEKSGSAAGADRMIEQIEAELTDTAERARSLVKEYDFRQANGYLTVSVSSWKSRAMSAVKKAAVLTLAVFVMLHVISFLGDIKRNRKKAD